MGSFYFKRACGSLTPHCFSVMNILFIGDIFGRPGRDTVKALLPEYRKRLGIHLVIANAENLHHGKGVSQPLLEEMQKAGVDFFTSGNHLWKEREVVSHLDDMKLPLIRPANYPDMVPGKGYRVIEGGLMQRVLVINLMGRVFMPSHLDCPFRTADRILKDYEHEPLSAIIIDFHAETTSEKMALAHYLDGRVSAVIGTHTHVPTFDARVLPGGTAFQTDVGFTGPVDSVIGLEKTAVIKNFITQVPQKHEIAEGETVFNAIKIEVDDTTKKAISVEQIQRYIENY